MAKNDYDKDGDNDMKQATPVEKFYGSPSFETGPGRGHKASFSYADRPASMAKGVAASGPKRNDPSIGHNAKGTAGSGKDRAPGTGDDGGKASGRRGDVKGY